MAVVKKGRITVRPFLLFLKGVTLRGNLNEVALFEKTALV